MSLLVAYWQKDRLEIYRFVDNQPVKQAAGPWNQLRSVHGTFDQKVLIVGRENLFHLRKRYPPAPPDKLAMAIRLEAGDLFPIPDPDLHFRIFESYPNYTLVDLWGWDKGEAERLREVFPYTYLIPEDLAFKPESTEVNLFSYGGMVHILAHSPNQFLGGTSYPDVEVEEAEIERFFHTLGLKDLSLKRLRIYGDLLKTLKGKEWPEIWRGPGLDFPLCLEMVPKLGLKEFKVKKGLQLPIGLESVFRLVIILLLGYGLALFLTVRNYDQGLQEIKRKIASLDQKKKAILPGPQREDYAAMVQTINEKIKRPSPVTIMDMLAQRLPKGTFINRLVFNENNLELAMSSKDPLTVVKELGQTEGIKSVKIKGPPNKDRASGLYSFAITIELGDKVF